MTAIADGLSISNGGAGATVSGRLIGGKYALAWKATTGTSPTIGVNVLAPDNLTWVSAFSSANASGYQVLDLPPGQVQIASTVFTAVYAALTRCGDD